MGNHLIIGLGGTGGKIIRSLRKTIFQEFRNLNPPNLHLDFLYVDSSNEMMHDDPSWKILGTSVQLGKANQLHIKGADLKTVLENVQSYPGVKDWIGDRQQWRDILNSIVGEVLGGQKRRLGRFLFAINAAKFNAQLQERVRSIQSEGNIAAVTFHILVGLAGGTGSGSLIDVLCQIRQLYNDPRTFRILVYALLPDRHPPQGWDTGNYHPNGYAALLELNALSIGRYTPHNVTGLTQLHQLQDPFNGCYVFFNENENGLIVDINRELPEIVSDFLYQKIIAIKDTGNWDTLLRMENAENGDGTPELSPGTTLPERGKRFLSFGIKRLVIPEEEIREYLTYNFAKQATLQLLYNNWQDTIGFYDQPKIQEFNELVMQDDVLDRWKLSNNHICLSVGILPSDINNPKWKPIPNEWQDVMPNFKLLIRDSKDAKEWLDELGKVCAKRFNEDFRGLGVKSFYQAKLKAKREIAKEIRRGLEAELFDDWRNGVKSLYDIRSLLSSLQAATEERLRRVEDIANKVKSQEETAADKLNANYHEWSKIGFFGTAFGKRDKLFESHSLILQELYIARTQLEAWQFAKELLQEFLMELADLQGEIDKTISTLKQLVDKYQNRISERCADEGLSDLKTHIIRFYEPANVRRITDRFIKDDQIQRQQTNLIRAALVGKLGEFLNFKAFNERIPATTLMDALEVECEQKARQTHDNLLQNPKDKILGVNIVEKLKDRYSGDVHALQTYVADLVKYAGHFINFSEIEKQKKGPGISDAPTCLTKFTVIVPKAQDTEFIASLKDAFKRAHPLGVEIIDTSQMANEITLVNITNLFPLRFVSPLIFLKEKYDSRVGSNMSSRPRLEIHTEGDGTQFPNLFVPTMEEVVNEGLPYLLVARSMGIILEEKNHTTGIPEILLLAKDQHGFEYPVVFGRSMKDAVDFLDIQKVNTLKGEVEKNKKNFLHTEKREILIKNIQDELNTLKTAEGFGPTYQRFLEAAQKAAAIIQEGM